MSNYEAFLLRPYEEGHNDCYSVLRDYILETYGLRLPNFARPTRFWEDPNLDLYGRYLSQGFVQMLDQPLALGDVLLMPIRTAMNSHAALVVADNLILHHFPGQLSSVEPLRPKWANRATCVIRHPKIYEFHQQQPQVAQLHEVINARVLENPAVQQRLTELLAPRE